MSDNPLCAALEELDRHLVGAMKAAGEKVGVDPARVAAVTDQEYLQGFWGMVNRLDTDAMAAAVFPDQPLSAAVDALETLAAYAIARSAHFTAQAAGDLRCADVYRQHCEIYYQDLPPWAIEWDVSTTPTGPLEARPRTVIAEDAQRVDWDCPCMVCDQVPTVPETGMCGPCTFGEADTAGGNW